MAQVLSEYLRKGDLSVYQAVKVVQDVLFNTSNVLYNLNIPLTTLSFTSTSNSSPQLSDLNRLISFLDEHPSIKFLRLNYLDYTAMPRTRVMPVHRALTLLQNDGCIKVGITKACLGILQNDTIIPGVTATGEYRLHPIFSSLRRGPSKDYGVVQCEFIDEDNSEVAICPRSVLRRTVQGAKAHGLEFLFGFEIEVVFMSRTEDGEPRYATSAASAGHAWNSAQALQGKALLKMINEIYESLSDAGIQLELFHAESSTGQYEFVLPPCRPWKQSTRFFMPERLYIQLQVATQCAPRYSRNLSQRPLELHLMLTSRFRLQPVMTQMYTSPSMLESSGTFAPL